MADTNRLALPLLQAAQAQKHVTVNEALVRLDGLTQLTLLSVSTTIPPALATDGDCYAVPVGAVNAWAGRDGEIAIYTNGGWVFATPTTGWTAWIADDAERAHFDGTAWIAGVAAMSPNGAALIHEVIEIDHVLGAGPVSTVIAALPAHSMVFGISGRVRVAMSGALSGWKLGVLASDNRYGSGLGTGLGSWVRGLTASPLTYYADTDLILTSQGTDFVDGEVRLSIHTARITLPST